MPTAKRLACSALLALPVALVAAPALAQSAASVDMTPYPTFQLEPPAAPSEARPRWYGWQMLVGYGVSDAMFAASVPLAYARDPGVAGIGGGFCVAGLSGHVLVGPIAHWANGHVARGFASLGMTLGAATVGAGLGFGAGMLAAPSSGPFPVIPAISAGVGGMAGILAANIVDFAVLARDEKRPDPRSFVGSLSITPIVGSGRGGVLVGGAF
ncbi:MAG TPA: hypothetical protein VHB21_09405 [Minicystis sp.]|nr:hypothetical protein [Minicystis sp.]